MRFFSQRCSLFHRVIIVIAIILTLLPIFNITHILATTGDNNPSNDDSMYVWPIEQFKNGNYSWKNIFADASVNSGHINVFVLLTFMIAARYFDFNVFFLLFLGIFLAILKLILLYDAFTFRSKNMGKVFLLPLLSALIFSTSQISDFEFDLVSIGNGLAFFGMSLGIWSLVRFPRSWAGMLPMLAGGILASWSHGGGPFVWPVFLLGMILLKDRRIFHYLVIFLAAGLSIFPYVLYFVIMPAPHSGLLHSSHFNLDLAIQALGLPFVRNFFVAYDLVRYHCIVNGLLGLSVFLAGVIIVFWGHAVVKLETYATAIMLIAYSFINIGIVTIFRGALAPWYSMAFMVFWIGLAGMAYLVWTERKNFD